MGKIARLVNQLMKEIGKAKLDQADIDALKNLANMVYETLGPAEAQATQTTTNTSSGTAVTTKEAGTPAPAPPSPEQLAEQAREELRRRILGSFSAKVAGWAWKRQLRRLRSETKEVLPLSWAEAFARMVSPEEPELVEASIRRWLRRILYISRGEPPPGSSEKPKPQQIIAAKAVIETINKARRLIEELSAPRPLKEALKLVYVAALANTMLNKTPDIYSLVETLETLRENPEEYVAESLARYGYMPSEEEVKQALEELKRHPPSPFLWLATGTLVPPPAQQLHPAPA